MAEDYELLNLIINKIFVHIPVHCTVILGMPIPVPILIEFLN